MKMQLHKNHLHMSFCDSKEHTSFVRLKYSRRLDKKYFCQEYFYGLFDGINIKQIVLLKQVDEYFRFFYSLGTDCGGMSINRRSREVL